MAAVIQGEEAGERGSGPLKPDCAIVGVYWLEVADAGDFEMGAGGAHSAAIQPGQRRIHSFGEDYCGMVSMYECLSVLLVCTPGRCSLHEFRANPPTELFMSLFGTTAQK